MGWHFETASPDKNPRFRTILLDYPARLSKIVTKCDIEMVM